MCFSQGNGGQSGLPGQSGLDGLSGMKGKKCLKSVWMTTIIIMRLPWAFVCKLFHINPGFIPSEH